MTSRRSSGAILALISLFLALPAASCNPPAASGAAITVMALGDTARISFHWPAVNKATGYTYTISAIATNGTWVGLPVSSVTTSTSGTAIATSSGADTAVFQLCAAATGAAGASAVGCSSAVASAANTWRRKLQPPVPVLDSVTVSIVPSAINLQLAGSRIACAFHGFKDGQVAEKTADKAACDSLYVKAFSTAQRTPTAAERNFSDTASWQWSTTNPAAVGLVPQGLGSSAVMVQGNGLTMLGQLVPLERYAASVWPVYRIDSTYRAPDGTSKAAVTCLRPGTAPLVVQSGTVQATVQYTCRAPAWQVRVAADALLIHPA